MGGRHCHNIAREFADLIQILAHHFGIKVNEGVDDEIHDMFDTRDVEAQ